MRAKLIQSIALTLSATIIASPAAAITAGDVLDRMEQKERLGFLGGAVDMASHLYAVDGNRGKADCIVTWFFDDQNSVRDIHALFGEHRDQDAVGLISVLINRRCGE